MSSFGPTVSASWLAEHLYDDDLVVVDSRWSLDTGPGRDAYAQAHIATAVFADLDLDLSAPPSVEAGRHPLPTPEAFAESMSRLGIGDSTRVVVYDDAAGLIAARLWWMLDVLDRQAAVLDGGLTAWTGLMATGPSESAPAKFSVTPWPANRVISKLDLAASLGRGTPILDARAPDRYANGGPVDPRPGHVPGAINAPAGANLGDGVFRDADELAAHYEALGADGDDVVAYCGSGVTACADLLGRRLAGLPDARLFVGSWSQWGADETLPTETGAG